MALIQRVLSNLEERRKKVLEGGINCIPTPFSKFKTDFPGVEQGKFYLISGASKSAKTQITNFLFLYSSVLFAYNNPDIIRLKIFYFPLEETPEKIVQRFMCYLLYVLSDRKIRISPLQLSSIDKENAVDGHILELLNSIEYRSILDFFESHVLFISDRNPTGLYKTVKKYAEESGITHKKVITIENKETGVKQEKEVFDYYEPKDPNEYVEIIVDHASLVDVERGMTKKESIDKLTEYCMVFRNRYNYIPVLLQQQNNDSISLEAVKTNRISPTLSGLADTKDTGKACTMMLGISNPFNYGFPKYLGYDISKLKGYARFLEVVLNREGESNSVLALYFDGAVNYFCPLPKYDDMDNLNKVYQLVQRNMGNTLK